MKKAFSVLELLIVLVVICSCVLIFWNKSTNPVKSAIQERKEMQTKQEMINSKLDEIQRLKNEQIENFEQNAERD